MPPFNVQPKTAATLTSETTPTSGTDLEAVPWDMFDTNTAAFVNAAVSLNVAFFQVVQADPTLGNMQMPGALPAPQWLEPAALACDILSIPSTGAGIGGAISDIASILKTSRAVFNIKVSQKDYGTFPLMLAHSIGGEIGYIASTVATSSQQYANNGLADGGWWLDGAIIVPSQQNFIVSILTSATALALAQTPTSVRMNLWGVLHRRVL